ncbi:MULTISPECIES: hypothetical protein [unclassified Thioalkalivibrio]|uniref:hypothetical protein n=1 Tax=unclassified Thioalkalivibrio TaxID=2621013 RepID=UPI0004779577|nr:MULTISPECIES: hypothetical protein [unclassified Thioalkalivibrio]
MIKGLRRVGLAAVGLWLTWVVAGCAGVQHGPTQYVLTSDPPGAEIYRGDRPDRLYHYTTTPFRLTTSRSEGWSGMYFLARKEGYHDSELHQQPTSAMGGEPIAIHLELEPRGDEEDFAPYRERDTLEAYREFLEAYPATPLREAVFERMVARIEESDAPEARYEELLEAYPEAARLVPVRRQAEVEAPELESGSVPEGGEQRVADTVPEDGDEEPAVARNDARLEGDAERVRVALEQQDKELDRRRAQYEALVTQQDDLRDELERQWQVRPALGAPDMDDSIARAAIPYCFEQYGRRAWENDPARMEDRCESELNRDARPSLEAYWRLDEEVQASVEQYSELHEERSQLAAAAEQWRETGETADALLAAVLDDEYDPTLTGVAPESVAEGVAGAPGGGEQCAIKHRQYDEFTRQLMQVARGTEDVCDHHKVNYLGQAWGYDLARICLEEGDPEIPPDEVEKLRQAMPELTRHFEQVDRRIGCQFDPTLTRLRREWGPVPY